MKIIVTFFKRFHGTATFGAPNPATGHHRRLPDTYGQVWVSLLWSHCSLFLVHTRFCLCPPRVCFPVLCKFWWLYGGVNGYLL